MLLLIRETITVLAVFETSCRSGFGTGCSSGRHAESWASDEFIRGAGEAETLFARGTCCGSVREPWRGTAGDSRGGAAVTDRGATAALGDERVAGLVVEFAKV